MAELNLNQIIDRLNAEFTGDTRKLVFWYDENAEFAEDMDSVKLQNAKVYRLAPDNQFYTKYFLERVDTETNYLIYAPFPKPDVQDNHLEDTLLYSKRFFADRASLLCLDLGIAEKYKPILESHIKFFASKERTQRFYDLEIESFTEENILVGIMSAICRTKGCSFEEVVRVVLTDGELEDNKYLAEMEKYDLLQTFWKLCEQQFGYTDGKPTLEKLVVTMFVTYTDKYLRCELPAAWKPFISVKSGNVIAFLDYLMNSVLYRKRYDMLSAHVEKGLRAEEMFASLPPEALLNVDTFLAADRVLVHWIMERLTAEDIGAKLDDLDIPAICNKRCKAHFADKTQIVYSLLHAACRLISAAYYSCPDGFAEMIEQYQKQDYLIDQAYREFYSCYDRLEQKDRYEELRKLVENIYTNEYLAKQLPAWNDVIETGYSFDAAPLQRNFYRKYIKNAKDRIVVIISDAMRYEVGQELFKKLSDDPKCKAKLDVQLSVLPSFTQLGMAALLPHNTLTITDECKVQADGVLSDNLAGRQTVLRKYEPNSVCIQYDDISSLTQAVLRGTIPGNDVVYIYHNQIDARGDKANTENEVFVACEEAVRELDALIHALSSKANTQHCIVTADHGFLYKRDKVSESDKINGMAGKGIFTNRRFVISASPIRTTGVSSMALSEILDNEDPRFVSFPVGANVFKFPGGGQNYVHGGSSPQEMLVPVIDVRTEKAFVGYTNAQIALVSMLRKVTNLIVPLDFIQSEPVSDTVKAATYRLFFINEGNEKISNENIYVADSREKDAQKRISHLRFTFKNQKYDRTKKYWLVVVDDATGMETFRHPVTIDIAFADDFGFGF